MTIYQKLGKNLFEKLFDKTIDLLMPDIKFGTIIEIYSELHQLSPQYIQHFTIQSSIDKFNLKLILLNPKLYTKITCDSVIYYYDIQMNQYVIKLNELETPIYAYKL